MRKSCRTADCEDDGRPTDLPRSSWMRAGGPIARDRESKWSSFKPGADQDERCGIDNAVELIKRLSHPDPLLSEVLGNHQPPARELVENRQKTGRTVRRSQRRLRSEEVAKLVQARLDGALVTELASEFGIHRSTVASILDRHGMVDRRGVLRPQDIQRAVELYEAGLSLATIAEHLGVYPSSV